MLSVEQASEIVLKNVVRNPAESAPLPDALGRVLAEDIASDIDMPPFDRSMMDGYALNAQDAQFAPARLEIVGFIPAGAFPKSSLEPGQAAKIMTGAPLPVGADAVREFEKTSLLNHGQTVEIQEAVRTGQNIVKQASELSKGEIVLTAGTYIHPAVVGLLASLGKANVQVFQAPRVAILSTGDELVEPAALPLQGQIRNSNSFTLQALCTSMGLQTQMLGIAKDDKSILRHKIELGLSADILLITGGVSVGDHDFVKDVFDELGLEIHFQKVAIKPGKPTVFAKNAEKVIFGLPGNPVSCATVFEVLVRPAIRKMLGYPVYHNAMVKAVLTNYFANRSQRENYHPCVTWYEEGEFFCRPLTTRGSGDISAYAKANSYLVCPIDCTELVEGTQATVILRDEYYLT